MQQTERPSDSDESAFEHPEVTVEEGATTLSLRISEERVELAKEVPKIESEILDDGSVKNRETTETKSVQMCLSEQSINQYTDFTAESEKFESTVSGKSDVERIALVEVSSDNEINAWHDPRGSVCRDSVIRLHDDSVWDHKLADLQGVKVKNTGGSSDTHRSYSKRKVRVSREAVEAADDRLIVLKWRDASGASKGNSGWSKFQPVAATEIRVE